jgi:transposase-like protein
MTDTAVRIKPELEGRLEDLRDLARWGVPCHEAAERVGLSVGSLQRWLSKHDPNVQERLTANSHNRGLTAEGALI